MTVCEECLHNLFKKSVISSQNSVGFPILTTDYCVLTSLPKGVYSD